MAITVMEVLKILPRTNCGDCGQMTCLAFATQVIKEGEDLKQCPHLRERRHPDEPGALYVVAQG